MAFYEQEITHENPFPVDTFIQDTELHPVVVADHWHDCFEILYMLEGQALQKLNQKVFHVQKGDLMLVKSGDIHGTFCEGDVRTRILVVKFMPSVIDARYSKLDGSRYIAAFLNKEATESNTLNAGQKERIEPVLSHIYEEFTLKDRAYDLRIKGYILELITEMVRQDILTIPDVTMHDYDLKRIGSVLNYIEKNYSRRISLQEISGILHMSYAYVSKYFKKATGTTFKAYLDFVRICEADKQLMVKSDYIYKIAEKCGFSSVNAFNRVYKRIKGYPPTELNAAVKKQQQDKKC